MPDSNPRDKFFYLPFTPMIDSYNPLQCQMSRQCEKTYLLSCTSNEDSNKPANPCSLISLFCPHEEALHPWSYFCWQNVSSFCKCYSHLFRKNISVYAIFNDQSFNDMLTNDIFSFEQLGPDVFNEDTVNSRYLEIQGTLWNTSRYPDIRTLTYQICRIEEKINQTTKFHK